MYVDLAGLSRYRQDLDAWARGALLPKDAAAARVRTEKAGAVSFVPVQETPLDVSVDFLFSETGPASGDKAPDNPSTITGVSSVKVTRANSNLIRWPYYDSSGRESGGVTWTVNADGSISASGTTTSFSIFRLQLTDRYPTEAMLVPRGSYRYSGCPSGGGGNIYRLDVAIYTPHASRATKTSDYGNGGTLVVTEPALCSFYCAINTGQTVSNLQFKPKLQLNGVDEPFEKNEQDVYTLPLGNTYYGGSVDLSTGMMTVKSQKLTIDENCTFTFFNDPVTTTETRIAIIVTIPTFPTSNMTKVLRATSSCDSFPLVRTTDAGDSIEFIMFGNVSQYIQYKQIRIYMLRSTLGVSSSATATEINNAAKTWFTSHPATFIVGYDEEPRWTTVQLTPTEILSLAQADKYTPRLNTVYTDAQAVQVGYLKHPSAASADLRSALVSLGGGV